MSELSGADRKLLRGHAHHLEPVVRIGHEGLTDAVVKAINEALETHELIKIKFVASKDEKDTIADDITRRARCELAGAIGNIGIFYRENPDKKKSKGFLRKKRSKPAQK
jgi:RNA-binding protein